jgi:cytochrome c oxidase subunit 3
MWAFLATEVLFFGGLFCAYVVYRNEFFDGFKEGSNHLNVWIGCLNTGVLLCSSFTAAMAVRASHLRRRNSLCRWLFVTALFGIAFIVIKLSLEYTHEYHEGLAPLISTWGPKPDVIKTAVPLESVRLFFLFYFTMTLIHALHMVIGVVLMFIIIIRAKFFDYSVVKTNVVEMTCLYWHFVDVVWIFLFPLLYLIR